MTRGFFVTGTDTDVGKTWSSVALMRALQAQGLRVVGMKPVAAGCEWTREGWRNQDALLLQQHASLAIDYPIVNPYAFENPVSPHIACGDAAVEMEVILKAFRELQTISDLVLVEGAGGWHSPLSRDFDNAGLARALGLPVILVVGMRLGCINHALLSYRAILQAGVGLAGWLAVEIDPVMREFQANLEYLADRIEVPLLGVLPHLDSPDFEVLAKFIMMETGDFLIQINK